MIKTYAIKKAILIKKVLKKDYKREKNTVTKKRMEDINKSLSKAIINIKNDKDKKNSIDYINEIYTMYLN